MSFIIAIKMIEYQGIKLTKTTEDLHVENYGTLIKDIEDDLNKWRDVLGSWLNNLKL